MPLSGYLFNVHISPSITPVISFFPHEEKNRPVIIYISEADFCARRTAAVSRQRRRTVHTPPDWLLKRVYGAERGKREKTAWRLGARALSVCILERLGAPRACSLCLLLLQQSDNDRAA